MNNMSHGSIKPDPSSAPGDDAINGEAKRVKRRVLLAAISAAGLAGTARLPNQWSRPVVDHVLLPAHAVGSITACTLDCIDQLLATIVISTSDGATEVTVSVTEILAFSCTRIPDGASISTSVTSSTVTNAPTSATTTFSGTSITLSTVTQMTNGLPPTACSIPLDQLFANV